MTTGFSPMPPSTAPENERNRVTLTAVTPRPVLYGQATASHGAVTVFSRWDFCFRLADRQTLIIPTKVHTIADNHVITFYPVTRVL